MDNTDPSQEVVEQDEPQDPGQLQARTMVRQLVAGVRQTTGPAHHPIFDKFESAHVTQFLNHAHESDEAGHRLQRGNRWFKLGYVLTGVGVFVFLSVWLLPEHSDLYLDILAGLGLFAAGAAGGYGFKAYQDQHREDG